MSNIEGIGNKFIVFKIEDVNKYITDNGKFDLDVIGEIISRERAKEGKSLNNYLVINTDEPYADKVIELMKEHEHWG